MLVLGGWAVGIWANATEQSISAQALISTSFRKVRLHPLGCIFPRFPPRVCPVTARQELESVLHYDGGVPHSIRPACRIALVVFWLRVLFVCRM